MNYERISSFSAFVAASLCLVLLARPEIEFDLLGVALTESSAFIGRRAAMLFLGIAVICWSSRKSPVNEARQAITLGVVVSMFALVVLGAVEFSRGLAGKGIWLAMLTETVIGLAQLKVWREGRAR